MKTFFTLYVVPIIGVIAISLIMGVLLAIVLNVLIFGEREHAEKEDKNGKRIIDN